MTSDEKPKDENEIKEPALTKLLLWETVSSVRYAFDSVVLETSIGAIE